MRVNGAWIKRYCVLCSKTYNTLHSCHNFPAGSRQAASATRICETSKLLTSPWSWLNSVSKSYIWNHTRWTVILGIYHILATAILLRGNWWISIFEILILGDYERSSLDQQCGGSDTLSNVSSFHGYILDKRFHEYGECVSNYMP